MDSETDFLKIKCSKSNLSKKKITVHEIQPSQESLKNHILKFNWPWGDLKSSSSTMEKMMLSINYAILIRCNRDSHKNCKSKPKINLIN